MGHAQNKRERLEKLEYALVTSRDGLLAKEIQDLLGCDRSTVTRYIQELSITTPLIEEPGPRYRIDPQNYISNVPLRIDEAMAVYLALRRFARQTTHAPNFVISALQKVAPALRHPTLTEQLQQKSIALRTNQLASDEQTEVWKTLLEGWREGVVVEIVYRKKDDAAPTKHEIEPYLFEPATLSHGNYVIAWSRTRGELRTFKVSRIERARLTTAHFDKPTDFDIDDLLRNAWGVWYGQKLFKVELLFAPGVASRVQETIWHPSQRIEVQPDGSVYWCVEVAATLELKSWVRGWGPDVRVLGPERFRNEIIAEMKAAWEQYEEVD